MTDNKFIQVELIQTFDLLQQKHIEQMNVKVGIKAIHSGLIKEIGATEFAVLVAIASFCDCDGTAFPSQRKLVELTGLSLPTINRVVNKLLETEVNGVPILYRQFELSASRKKFSVYTVNEIAQQEEATQDAPAESEVIEDENVTEVVYKRTARDFAFEFKNRYERAYNIPYVINYAKDTSLIKKKLIGQFTEEQILQMFDYIIENYRNKWAKPNYPYPTISMVCSWLGNVAIQQMTEHENQLKEAEAIQTLTESYKDTDYSDFDML